MENDFQFLLEPRIPRGKKRYKKGFGEEEERDGGRTMKDYNNWAIFSGFCAAHCVKRRENAVGFGTGRCKVLVVER